MQGSSSGAHLEPPPQIHVCKLAKGTLEAAKVQQLRVLVRLQQLPQLFVRLQLGDVHRLQGSREERVQAERAQQRQT